MKEMISVLLVATLALCPTANSTADPATTCPSPTAVSSVAMADLAAYVPSSGLAACPNPTACPQNGSCSGSHTNWAATDHTGSCNNRKSAVSSRHSRHNTSRCHRNPSREREAYAQ